MDKGLDSLNYITQSNACWQTLAEIHDPTNAGLARNITSALTTHAVGNGKDARNLTLTLGHEGRVGGVPMILRRWQYCEAIHEERVLLPWHCSNICCICSTAESQPCRRSHRYINRFRWSTPFPHHYKPPPIPRTGTRNNCRTLILRGHRRRTKDTSSVQPERHRRSRIGILECC